MRYVSLHTHSTFSFGDGFGPVDTHVRRVGPELGMKAVAFTEHGNCSSHAQAEKAGIKHNVKILYGCELYISPPETQRKWHQTVLAMNEVGYQNLNRIVSRSWSEGFYYYPTVSSDILKEHSEGLIVLSGCADSLLSCTLLGGKSYGDKRLTYSPEDFTRAVGVVEWYQQIFGDRYYLEVQRFPGLDRTCALNPALERLSAVTGARLVGTADVHYPYPEDNEMQRVLHSSHRGSTVDKVDASWEYDILLTYPMSDGEIYRDLQRTGLSKSAAKRAVLETEKIAERCNVILPKNEPIKWPFDKSQFDSIEDYTWQQLRDGWAFRWSKNPHMREHFEEYNERVKYEMERIIPRGFCDYFAMLSYLVVWAKDRKIPVGPARGSAAASLVCYLLRITEVDPLQFPTMVFERFIDPKRLDLPDVDLDFADDRRDEVRQEAVRVFGADRVGNIGNFTRYRGKNSIDDIARVYQIPSWEGEKIKKLIIDRSSGDSRLSDSLQDTFDMFPAAAKVVEQFPQFQLATRLEGNYRGLGVHAAGLVISNKPITDTCAVYTRESNGRQVSVVAYDKKDAEYLGMLKADFLGLKTMGAIGLALEATGIDLEDLYSVPLTEKKVLAAFKSNDVTGIFQFEGRATRLVCADVSPDHFMHLADINALSRPGPLFSGMTAAYTEVKHGRKEAEKLHPIVDEFTKHSYGQIVYQEQVLGVIRDLGGFPVQRVGDIRKIISQKLGEASFNTMYEEFEQGAFQNHRVEPELAKHIWKFLVTSATYSFCVTGDTVLERAGKGRNCDDEFVTVEELYRQQHDRTNIPMSDKIRGGRMKILGMDDDGRIRPNNLLRIEDPVDYRCTKITTDTGRTVTVSNDHRMMTADGYRHTMELQVGDQVVVSLGKEGREAERISEYKAKHTGQKYKSWEGERQYDIIGAANPAWIDGRSGFLKAAQDEEWEASGGECRHCGLKGSREGHKLEFAHVMPLEHFNGEYEKYHSAENLMVLCNSCHKKYDYQVQGTRHKRWSVGRPTGLETIVSIEDAGIQPVYDISMAGPSHNYQGNGFIHHNNIAHCISYSMLAFWLQWLKQYEPAAFYAAQLTKVGDGKKEEPKRAKLMRDAERHGVRIKPPSFVLSGASWVPDRDNNEVLAGFSQMKGIGVKTFDKIESVRQELVEKTGEGFTCWEDLEKVPGIGPKTVAKMVEFSKSDDPFELRLVARILEEFRQLARRPGSGVARATHTSEEIPREGEHEVVWYGIVRNIEYKDLIEDQRARTGDTVEEILARTKDPTLIKSCVLHCYDDGEEEVYIRFNRFNFPKFKELIESIETESDIIVVRGNKREDFGISLHAKSVQVISPQDNAEEDENDE